MSNETLLILNSIITYNDLVSPPIITSVGAINNIIIIAVLGTKEQRKNPATMMMLLLAVTDEVVVLGSGITWLLENSKLLPQQAWNDKSCQILDFIVRLSISMSSWLIVFISIDRTIAVCYTFSEKVRPAFCERYVVMFSLLCVILFRKN